MTKTDTPGEMTREALIERLAETEAAIRYTVEMGKTWARLPWADRQPLLEGEQKRVARLFDALAAIAAESPEAVARAVGVRAVLEVHEPVMASWCGDDAGEWTEDKNPCEIDDWTDGTRFRARIIPARKP